MLAYIPYMDPMGEGNISYLHEISPAVPRNLTPTKVRSFFRTWAADARSARAQLSMGEMMFKWAGVDGCDWWWLMCFFQNLCTKMSQDGVWSIKYWEILGAGPIVDGGHQKSVAEWCATNNARWTSENDPGIRGFITRSCDFSHLQMRYNQRRTRLNPPNKKKVLFWHPNVEFKRKKDCRNCFSSEDVHCSGHGWFCAQHGVEHHRAIFFNLGLRRYIRNKYIWQITDIWSVGWFKNRQPIFGDIGNESDCLS